MTAAFKLKTKRGRVCRSMRKQLEMFEAERAALEEILRRHDLL